MKSTTLKTLKITDVLIQVFLLIFFGVRASLNYEDIMDTVFPGYFIIGGYQFASCMLQYLYPAGPQRPPLRALYEKMLQVLVAIGVITIPFFLFFLMALLFVSPIYAIFYCWLSIDETLKLMSYEK